MKYLTLLALAATLTIAVPAQDKSTIKAQGRCADDKDIVVQLTKYLPCGGWTIKSCCPGDKSQLQYAGPNTQTSPLRCVNPANATSWAEAHPMTRCQKDKDWWGPAYKSSGGWCLYNPIKKDGSGGLDFGKYPGCSVPHQNLYINDPIVVD